MKKLIAIMLFLATISIAIQSCSNNNIVGTWERNIDDHFQTMELNADKTFSSQIYDSNHEPLLGCHDEGTYNYDGKTMTMIDRHGYEESTKVSVSGNTLTIRCLDDGTDIIYKRK